MSKIHSIDFEYDHDYALIGIHSVLEDYRMAFFLNDQLQIRLERFHEDLDFSSGNCSFPLFTFEDESAFTSWSLIANKFAFVDHVDGNGSNLFPEETKISYLIPEKKNVDYFIKIAGLTEDQELVDILDKINKIQKIMTAYAIDPLDLRSKDNLIF